ncbi:MAG: EAL domain-containing protein [Trueperaceae bacterium]|nr:EAL domain-containing protein [Trueperaceae bacterium]
MFETVPHELLVYLFLTGIAALLSGFEAAFIALRATVRGRFYFAGFLLCIVIWSAIAGIYVTFEDLSQQIFWAKLEYFGIVPITVLWALFVVRYTDTFTRLLNYRNWLLAIPVLTLALVFTNDYHHLIWTEIYFDYSGAFPLAIFEHGWYYDFVHVPYSYSFIVLSVVLLGMAMRRSQPDQRGWLVSLMIASLMPFFAVAAYNLGFYDLDLVPVAFTLSSLLIIWSMRFQNLHRRALVAHHIVLNSISDAVFVLNANDELIDLNRAARTLGPKALALGQPIGFYLEDMTREVMGALKAEGRFEQAYNGHYYSFSFASLTSPKDYALLVAKDITEQELAKQKLERQRAKLEAVVEISETLRVIDSLGAVYRAAVTAVLDKTNADLCTLFFYREATDLLEPVICLDEDKGYFELGKIKVPRQQTLSGQVISQNDTVFFGSHNGINRAFRINDQHEGFSDKLPPKELIASPIRDAEGKIIAILTANIHKEARHFDQSDTSFFEAIAEACSSAFSRLFFIAELEGKAAEYQKLFAEAAEQASELELLNQLSLNVAADLDPQLVIKKVVEAMITTAGYEQVALYLLNEAKLSLSYQVGYENAPLELSQEYHRQILSQGEARILTQGLLASRDGAPKVSLLAPLHNHDQVIGVLWIESTAADAPEPKDLRWLMQVARQISMALERANLHKELSLKEQRFRLITSHMSDMIVFHQPDGYSSYISPSCESLLGYGFEQFGLQDFLELVHEQDQGFLNASVLNKLMQGEGVKPFQYRLRKASGEYIWVETFINAIAADDGKHRGFVSSTRDITDRKQMQEQMLEGALLYDSLTGLPNRTLFMDRLEHTLRRQERENKSFAVLFIDLDRFKVINDSLGHNVGDQLLIETGQRLQACVRTHDTVARLGGDEFALILDGVNESVAQNLAERISQTLVKPFMIDGYPVMTSASIGITMGDTISDSGELLRSADLAMYHVKTHGKAGHALFTQAMHQQARETLDLELELRYALQKDEFLLHYQPIVDLARGQIAGFEALIRWQNPKRGMVSPNVFIPIAEEVGLIPSIDDWVLRHATSQLAEWHSRFPHRSNLTMSVNLSTKNFALTNIVDRIAEVIGQSGIPASLLKLEITESVLMENADVARYILAKLRRLGVTLQIDDFGTGYSSLGYLHNLPLQSLKMDRSFVQGLAGTQAENAIASSIVALAQSLKLDVVAEGIETKDQLRQIRMLGCQYGQGYLFSEPLSKDRVESVLLPASETSTFQNLIEQLDKDVDLTVSHLATL